MTDLPSPSAERLSRFDGPLSPPSAAVALLRARASSLQVPLVPVSDVDAAAAALAADAWMLLTRASSLEFPSGWSPQASRVLSAVLARASGHGAEVPDVPPDADVPSALAILSEVDAHSSWARELCPSEWRLVLRRAGWDLAAAPDGRGAVLASYGAALWAVSSG